MLGEPDVPAAPGDRVVWRRADMRSAPPTPSIWGAAVPLVAVLAPWGKEET